VNQHDVTVVHFMRHLSARIAGGARAVLQRANLYAEAGYRSDVVVMGVVHDHEIARLLDLGMLDPRVTVRSFWHIGPSWSDREAAARHEPLMPPAVVERGTNLVREVLVDEGRRCARTSVDGVERHEEWTSPDGRRLWKVRLFDEQGRNVETWMYCDAQLALVHEIDPETGLRLRTHYVVDGRLRWMTAELDSPMGMGAATLHATGERTELGRVLASALDRTYADVERLVVFADGENVCQYALRTMKHPGLRGVSILHNSHLDEPYHAEASTKEHWKLLFDDLHNVDVMVCLTGRQSTHLRARYGDLPLRVVHHSVPAPPTTTVDRERHRAVFVGRLADQKRIDQLFAAFARVVEQVPDARLSVYGTGPLQLEAAAFVELHGLEEHVDLHGFTAQPLEAFAGSTVALMTSKYEGLPLTLTEGMSVGTPFVAYDINYGPAEVIRHGVDGFLVEPGDVDGLADHVVRLLQDADLARATGTAARDVVERFSPERYRDAWVEVLEDVLRDAGAREKHTTTEVTS
jgi:glycosyltransferase involved in cell wall biosynthesis